MVLYTSTYLQNDSGFEPITNKKKKKRCVLWKFFYSIRPEVVGFTIFFLTFYFIVFDVHSALKSDKRFFDFI